MHPTSILLPSRPADRPTARDAIAWLALGALLALLVVFRPLALGGSLSLVVVAGTSMEPAIHGGDLAVVIRTGRYAAGDVIAYAPDAVPSGRIIHRIVGGDATGGFVTRGDARATVDPDHPLPATIDGEVVAVVPGVGLAIAALRSPLVLAALVVLTAGLLVGVRARPRTPGTGSPG